jgi:hypothetical protein
VGHGWREHYEVALVAWMRKEKPTLEQVEAVVIWASRRRSLGPNVAEHISSPDPDRPEDFITTIRKARVAGHARARLLGLLTSRPVGESPPAGLGDDALHALRVVQLAGVVAKIELGKVAVKVLGRNVVVRAIDAAR